MVPSAQYMKELHAVASTISVYIQIDFNIFLSQWDLVCARDYLPDLSQSIIVVGFAIGAVAAGPLADRFGRRPTQLISLAAFIVFGLAVSLSPNYVIYVSLRFAVGAAMMVSSNGVRSGACTV